MLKIRYQYLEQLNYESQITFLLNARFPFVVIVGGSVCLLGIAANAILLRIFSVRTFRSTNFTYLMVLAIFDIALLVNYILLIGLGLCKDYFESLWLHQFWYVAFALSFGINRSRPNDLKNLNFFTNFCLNKY